MSHTSPEQPLEDWTACSVGALRELAAVARRQRRRQLIVRTTKLAGAAGSVVGLLLIAGFFANAFSTSTQSTGSAPYQTLPRFGGEPQQANFACRQVLETRDSFLLGDVSDATRNSVRDHLSHCAHCQALYRQRAQELQVEFTVLVLPRIPTERFALR